MKAGVGLYRLLLRLLPAGLRARAGDEMVEVVRVRLARARGPIGRLRALGHEIGGLLVTSARARWAHAGHRRGRGVVTGWSEAMETLLQDLRFAGRTMRRNPGPTLVAVLAFALGIAASTAMFSVVDAVLLRPLPFPEPDRIVSVYTKNPAFEGHPTLGDAAERGSWSYPEFETVRDVPGVMDGLAAISYGGGVLYGGGEPERVSLGLASADLFSRVLRVRPIFGRVFDAEDVRAGGNVILLSEGYWRRRFGADPAVVGSTVRLGDEAVTIVGVLPQEAHLAGFDVEGWRPLGTDDANWGNHWLFTVGRLAEGVHAQQAADRMAAALTAAAPPQHTVGHGVNVFPRQADETRGVRGPLFLLTIAAFVLLGVACGNVAVLLVGAAIDREQELAVRAALGAGRGRLVRQLLTESLLLSLVAAALGILLAGGATRALVLLAPDGVPRVDRATIDGGVLAFGVTLSVVCGLVFGLIPALGFSRTDLRSAMVSSRGTTGHRARLQGIVVVGELALATVLLVGGGLLARTVLALNNADPAFAASETLALRIAVPVSRITRGSESQDERAAAVDAFYRTVSDRIEAIPGVRGVAITSNVPLTGDRANNDIAAEGLESSLVVERRFVSAGFFDVMGIRVIEGRGIEAGDDRPDAPVNVVISEGLARTLWPDGRAVGRRFGYWGREGQVIGVVADIRDEELQTGTTLAFYAARRQAGQLGGSFVIRADADPRSLIPRIRQQVRDVHEGIAIVSLVPLTDLIADQVAAERYRARLVLVFSGLAGLFAILGIYGVTTRSVAARTRELGIRMALGARRSGILGLVVRQALRLSSIGAVLGIIASLAATRGIEAYLWGVPRTDPVTLVAIALMLGLASVLAALAPGRRATRVDPATSLRAE